MHAKRSVSIALCAFALAGCVDQDAPQARAPATSPDALADGKLASKDAAPTEQDGRDGAARDQRKIIQNAEVRLEVDSYASARRELDALLASHGGYVADVTVEHVDGNVSRAQLVLRVPNERLASFLSETAGAGEVLHEQLRSQDITDQYVDLESRLRNAKRLESRLIELVGGNTDTVADLLAVERELARVRGEIEQMEGQKRLWDKQVDLSTVNVDMIARRVYASAPPKSLVERVESIFDGSVSSLLSVARGALLLMVALVPWLLPLLLLAWTVRRVARLVRSRRAPPASPYVVSPTPPRP